MLSTLVRKKLVLYVETFPCQMVSHQSGNERALLEAFGVAVAIKLTKLLLCQQDGHFLFPLRHYSPSRPHTLSLSNWILCVKTFLDKYALVRCLPRVGGGVCDIHGILAVSGELPLGRLLCEGNA